MADLRSGGDGSGELSVPHQPSQARPLGYAAEAQAGPARPLVSTVDQTESSQAQPLCGNATEARARAGDATPAAPMADVRSGGDSDGFGKSSALHQLESSWPISSAAEAPAAHGAPFRADSAESEGGAKGPAMKASPLVGPGRLDSATNALCSPGRFDSAFRVASCPGTLGNAETFPLCGPGRFDSTSRVAAYPKDNIPVEGGLAAEGGGCGRPSSVAPCSEDAILVGGGPGAEGGACRSSCWILYLSLYICIYFRHALFIKAKVNLNIN